MTTTVHTPRISISSPQLGREVEELVLSVLRSGHLAQGAMVERFEGLCAEMAGVRHAVAVANGTLALDAALNVRGIGPGDEVITSPFTFAATINAVLRSGAVVRFADICTDHTIDPASVESLVGPSTAAILPIHLYGLMADMTSIGSFADRRGLTIIEDAAQAHGGSIAGRRAGSFGLGCFSFYATKNVTSGEGGCVTTDDGAMAERLRVLRNQGMQARYDYVTIGQNWRMTNVAAAIAIPQMERLEQIISARQRNAEALTALLAGEELVTVPRVPAGRTHVWHQYTVVLDPAVDRDGVAARMAQEGVDTGVYYPRLAWDHAAYRGHPGVRIDDTPRARRVTRHCLSLPVHPGLSGPDLERIAGTLSSALHAS